MIILDNSVVVNAINAKMVRCPTIDPLQLIFLTAALYDIEISSNWLSSEDNWIADALSHFSFYKIANIFPQFQTTLDNLCGQTGKPMSILWESCRPSLSQTHKLVINTCQVYWVSQATFAKFAVSKGFN